MLSSLLKRMENTECTYDRQGKVIIAPTLKKVGNLQRWNACGPGPGRMDIYDRQGRALASHYDEVGPFSEGLAAVKTDGKWGYIDKQELISQAPV